MKITTFILFLFIFNCQTDDDFQVALNPKKEHEVSLKRLTIQDLRKIYKLESPLNRVDRFFKKKEYGYRITSSDSTFAILTDRILETTLNSLSIYTFLIENPTRESSAFENFVMKEIEGDTFEYFIYRYTPNNKGGNFPYRISIELISDEQIDSGILSSALGKETMQLVGSDGCLYTLEQEWGCMDYQTPEVDCFWEWVIKDRDCDYDGDGNGSSGGSPPDPNVPSGDTDDGIPNDYEDPTTDSNNNPPYSAGTGGSNQPPVGILMPKNVKEIFDCMNAISDPGSTDNTVLNTNTINWLIDNKFQASLINNFLKENVCDENSQQIVDDFEDILEKIPNAKFDRYLELLDKIEENPFFLIQDCAEQNGLDTSNYLDLYNLPFPQECTDKLNNTIGAGNVPCANIDYYSVEITEYPDLDGDNIPETEAEIYQAFRNNFIDFGSGQANNFQFSCDINFDDIVDSNDRGDIDWEFEPITSQDGVDFVSNDPVTSILLIEASATGIGSLAADDGAVIVTHYNLNNWTIATIYTDNNGSQPFSGNRQWGWLINQNGNLELFTRAVDVANVSELLNFLPGGANLECQQDTYYNIAEATWKNMQQEIVDWINLYDGQANLVPSTAVKVDKEQIEDVLTSNESIDQIEYNCN